MILSCNKEYRCELKMSSKTEKDGFDDLLDYGILKEEPLNLKGAIISYNMPFSERHPKYQAVLINEFTKLIQKNSKRRFFARLTF